MEAVLGLQASNLNDYAQGKTPEIVLDAKVWETTLKIAKELPNLQFLDKVINGEVVLPEVHTETNTDEAIIKPIADGNPFERRSAVIKDKLNGSTNK